mgnify:CR=1 FL=1
MDRNKDPDYLLGGTPSTLREFNTSIVLDRVRRGGTVSRASLARELNLSLPAISKSVQVLLRQNYILEVGPGESSGGKRPTILRFNAERNYVIGVGVDVDYIEVTLADLAGEEKATLIESFEKDKKPNEVIELIEEYIQRIVETSCIEYDKIGVVVLGLPAMVNTRHGVVELCPTLPEWEGKDVVSMLSSRLNRAVLADNVANLSLLGETWKGSAVGYRDAALVAIGTGIAAGVMIDGRIYRGAEGAAGEVGYMIIDRTMSAAASAPFGQFEYMASNTTLKRNNIRIGMNVGRKTNGENLEDLGAKAVMAEVIENIAIGICNLTAVLNPEVVVVRAPLFYPCEGCFEQLQSQVYDRTPLRTRLVRSTLGEKDITIGAIRLGLDHLDEEVLSPLFLK